MRNESEKEKYSFTHSVQQISPELLLCARMKLHDATLQCREKTEFQPSWNLRH